MKHTPVLLQEVIKYLDPRPNQNFIDATLGDGGHAVEILKRIAPAGKLLGIDWDPTTLRYESELRGAGPTMVQGEQNGVRGERGKDRRSRLETGSENLIASEPLIRSGIEPGPLFLAQGNFADIEEIVLKFHFDRVKGVLFDFGVSSSQLDYSGRGFSYLKDEPLDMRFYRSGTSISIDGTAPTNSVGAEDIVNDWRQEELERIFKEYGEERNARRIARAIAEARQQKRILTTGELVEILDRINPDARPWRRRSPDQQRRGRTKTLSRIFQALRIAVNNELANIKQGLAGAWQILKPGGRIAAISFHSLEDRIVKNFFNEKKRLGAGEVLTPKPITASDKEIRENSRAKSAKLRAIRKI